MKIAVAGMGYVGLSLAVLFARHHTVSVMDLAEEKVKLLSQGKSPVRDPYIESYLKNGGLDLTATTDEREAYEGAQFVVIAVPTNYDAEMNSFDTTAVEAVIRTVIRYNPDAVMVIKSTVPIGYTQHVRMLFRTDNILFSPEFLREGKALYDNLYPSRIIVGTDMDSPQLMGQAKRFAALLEEGAEKPSVEVLFMGFAEAEAVQAVCQYVSGHEDQFFSMNWIPMQRSSGLIQNRSSGAFAWIPGLECITIILLLATGDTVCPRTPGSFWPVMRECRKP